MIKTYPPCKWKREYSDHCTNKKPEIYGNVCKWANGQENPTCPCYTKKDGD